MVSVVWARISGAMKSVLPDKIDGLIIARALARRDTARAAKQTSHDRNCIREWTDLVIGFYQFCHWDGLEIEDKGA
jgi:hypothetical protein